MGSLIAPLRRAFTVHARRPALEGPQWLLDYRDLDHDSAALAAALMEAGVRPGHQVPMAVPRSPQMVIAALAILRCGAAYAPLDLANPPERLSRMLDILDSPVVLVAPGVTLPAAHAARAIDLQDMLARATLPASPQDWPAADVDAVACVMFTSGSTGAPKAVQIPQRGIARLVLDNDYANFRADSRWAHAASPAFDASLLEIWAPLLNGGCCVVQERAMPALDQLADFLVERRISDAWLTSALFNTMVDDQLESLGGLRQLLTGGETMSVAHARACLARWPALRLINGYGPTENTTFSLTHEVTAGELVDGESVPIGRPLRGSPVRVVPLADLSADATAIATATATATATTNATATAVPTKIAPKDFALDGLERGELWLGGAGVALGYLGDADETARRFVADANGALWYRSGDRVARRADGVFLFEGRIDRQVKVRGHRVELDVLESLLAHAPGVTEVVVLVTGETADTRQLVACVGGGGISPDAAALRDWLAVRVAAAAVPDRWIVRPRLPQNANGKLDRAALRAWTQSAPGTGAGAPPVSAGAMAEPSAIETGTETALLALWSRQFPAAALHRESDYRLNGGHSLGALRLVSDIEREFGRRVDALALLRESRLDAQARLIDAAPRSADRSADSDRDRDPDHLALTDAQQALLNADALDASGTAYLVHRAWAVGPGLERARLRRAFEALVNRHPVLRLRWRRGASQRHAHSSARAPSDLVRHHGKLDRSPTQDTWPDAVLATLRGSLSPETAGPMRVDTWALPQGGLLVVCTFHHAVIDAWSLERIRIEIDSWLRDDVPDWPNESSQPVAVDEAGVRRQAARLARDWARRAPLLPRAPGVGGDVELPLPDGLDKAVQALAFRTGQGAFAPLLAAWGSALQSVFGDASRDVLVPFARRQGPDADRAIGYHLELRLIEAGRRPGESPTDALARVNDELLEARRPLQRPLDRLADALSDHDPSLREALTQFSLTWQPGRETVFSLAGAAASEIVVPQGGARFGLTLHLETSRTQPQRLVARLEALQLLFDDGRAAAAGQAFIAALWALCASPHPVSKAIDALAPPASEPVPQLPEALIGAAAQVWEEVLGHPPAGPDDDFLMSGGSSLLATRLAARLRRNHGRELDLARFLSVPRFGALCAGLAQAPAGRPHAMLRLGPANARRLVLLIPGGAGGPLGLYTLAVALRDRLPDDWAIAIVDLGALMQEAPDPPTAEHFSARLLQIARDLGTPRLAAIAGFSLGGLMALDIAAALAPEAPAVCLIDTYAPQRMRLDLPARLQRMFVQAMRDPIGVVRHLHAMRRGPEPGSVEADPQFPRWCALMNQMGRRPLQASRLRATLIHSGATARESGLIRFAGTNGFDPSAFAALHRQPLPYDHLALLRIGAPEVAEAIARAAQSAV